MFHDPHQGPWGRREFLRASANGFGMLGLASVLAQSGATSRRGTALGAPLDLNTASAAAAHSPEMHPLSKARQVIFLFMTGGPSHVDMFDPKPRLTADHGQPLPFAKPKLARTTTENLMRSPFRFQRHGESGLEISELLPHLGSCADDLCVVRSMLADNVNHSNACLQMHTGEQVFSRPSFGSWLLYGLGSENQDLPGFIVISPGAQDAALWGSSFLPATFQGTPVKDIQRPIANLDHARVSASRQRRQLDYVQRLNRLHEESRADDSRLEARIASMELAFRMQVQAPEAFNLEAESAGTQRMYGIDQAHTAVFGRQCLLARRLVERGVRCVEVFSSSNWDHHTALTSLLPQSCAGMDQPAAALLKDLKSRGLLDETLVVWGGEFGRSPVAQKGDGRDHHPYGFSMWLAGAGVRGGLAYGATDEFGWNAVEKPVHVHDLHATMLHLMGIDHEQLTYRYSGRDYRLTDVAGNVVHDILTS